MTVEHGSLRLAVLPGDGVGPEVTAAALRVLETSLHAVEIDLVASSYLIGGAALEASGDPLPKESLSAARASDAVLLGAVEEPAWNGAGRTGGGPAPAAGRAGGVRQPPPDPSLAGLGGTQHLAPGTGAGC